MKRWPRFTDIHSNKKRAGIGDRTLKWCLLIYDSCSALSKDLITDLCHLFSHLLMLWIIFSGISLYKMKNISILFSYWFQLVESTRTIREDDESYRMNPTISVKMHCVLFVINADLIVGGEHDLLQSVQRDLQQMSKCCIV